MTGRIEKKLAAMGESLPDAPPPAANYVPFVRIGDLLFVSGQLPKGPDGVVTGQLGTDMEVAEGQAAARLCVLNLLAQVKAACGGDLDRLVRVVKLGGFVNASADFTDHHLVINGASDFIGDLLGEAGKHSRAAVGAASLPLGMAVEIDGIFQVR